MQRPIILLAFTLAFTFVVSIQSGVAQSEPRMVAQPAGMPHMGMHQPQPASLLGTPTRLILSCKDVLQSMSWWTRLGFNPAPGLPMKADSAISLTDGQVVITLVSDALPSPIMVFSCPSIKTLKDSLEALQINTTFDVKGPSFGEVRLLSPNGVYIAARPNTDEAIVPVTGDSNRICGKLTEYSIGTGYLKKEQQYWEKLGFLVKRAGTAPYNFALITDNNITVGLHENRDIVSLTLTYFAEDMADRVDRLVKAGIEVTEETPDPSGRLANVRIVSPDGQTIFLFRGNQ